MFFLKKKKMEQESKNNHQFSQQANIQSFTIVEKLLDWKSWLIVKYGNYFLKPVKMSHAVQL